MLQNTTAKINHNFIKFTDPHSVLRIKGKKNIYYFPITGPYDRGRGGKSPLHRALKSNITNLNNTVLCDSCTQISRL